MKSTEYNYSLIPTESGHDTIIIEHGEKNLPLHSKKNPGRERSLIDTEMLKIEGNKTLYIVLGCGLGYHLEPLRHFNDQTSHVIVIDILQNLEAHIRSNTTMSFLTSHNLITLFCGYGPEKAVNQITKIFSTHNYSRIRYLEHPASIKIFPDYYTAIRTNFQKYLEKHAGQRATIRHLGKLFFTNSLKNVNRINSLYPVQLFHRAFSSMPALVCSSGPGLDAIIDALHEKIDDFLIIAVDSALLSLTARGITPDILVSIDPQPWIIEHLGSSARSVPLGVTALTAYPAELGQTTFLSLNTHPLSQIIDHLYPGVTGSINSATGSVSGDALSLALLAGCEPIYLAGQDFGFLKYTTYARDSAYQYRYRSYFQTRINPVENQNLLYIMKSSGNYRKNGILTRRSFDGYRQAMEKFLENSNNNQHIFQISDGFPLMPIKSLQIRTLKNLLPNIGNARKNDSMINLLEKTAASANPIDRDKIKSFITQSSVMDELARELFPESDIKQIIKKIRGLLA